MHPWLKICHEHFLHLDLESTHVTAKSVPGRGEPNAKFHKSSLHILLLTRATRYRRIEEKARTGKALQAGLDKAKEAIKLAETERDAAKQAKTTAEKVPDAAKTAQTIAEKERDHAKNALKEVVSEPNPNEVRKAALYLLYIST